MDESTFKEQVKRLQEVNKVIEKGPSKTAGLEDGDIIVAFKGRVITNLKVLRIELGKCKPGKNAVLTVMRFGDKVKVKIKVGSLKKGPKTGPVKSEETDTEGELF